MIHVRPGRNGLWVVGTDDARELTELTPKLDAADLGNWSVTERGIVYYDREEATLSLLDVSTSSADVLASISEDVPATDPAIAVDGAGDRAFVSVQRRLESDLEAVRLPAGN